MPPIKREWERINLQLTPPQHKELKKLADKKMMNMAELIRRGIDMLLDYEKAKR